MRRVVGGGLGLLVWLLAPPAWSAATLTGVVSLLGERGQPARGVEISARGANAVTTGDDGLFVLTFPQGHPGQDIRVGVKRTGWDVVNDILLDQRLPDTPNARPLEIIICPSAEREPRVAEFYRLKGTQAVELTYRTKLAELEGRQAATAEERDRLLRERDRLLRERDQALAQVQEWARQAAARKADEIGGTYHEALRLFVEGKADAALQLLSDDRLQQEADKAKEQLHQAVQGWLLKGQLLASKFDYEAAGRAYDKAVTSAPGSAEAWFAYAHFHQHQNHFAQGRRGYEQALTLARQASDNANVALTLNNLGVLSRDENRHADAHKQFEETLDLYRALAKHDPDVYLPYVALTLNNLGVLSRDENRHADARKQFEEALDLYRTLAKHTPDVYLPDIATTLNNLGVLNRAENRNADARMQFEEALDLLRALAKHNPDVHLPDVATTLNNLGVLSRAENRHADARKQFEESLDIHRTLAKHTPNVYLPDVATALTNLGILSRDENRHADARKQFEKALNIRRALAKHNPDVYLPDVANTLNNLGVLSRDENRHADARKQFEEALDLLRALARHNPNVYLPYVATTLNNLGILSRAENHHADARKQFEEALDIFRQFAARAPATYRPCVRAVEDLIRALPK